MAFSRLIGQLNIDEGELGAILTARQVSTKRAGQQRWRALKEAPGGIAQEIGGDTGRWWGAPAELASDCDPMWRNPGAARTGHTYPRPPCAVTREGDH